MSNSVHPIIERVRKAEELRKERIQQRIRELEISVKSCNPKSLSQVYVLGEERTAIDDARRISMLIAQFELDCRCAIKPI